MGQRFKQKILNRRLSNGQKTFQELLKILSHQRKVNQNDSEISSYTCQNGYDQNHQEDICWRGRGVRLLVGVQTCTTTLEMSMAIS